MPSSKSYATATAFRRALEDRLQQIAKKEDADLQRLRKQVPFDRLLVRLFAQEHPQWLLKGGYALELRIKDARATRDIDLVLKNGDASILKTLQEIASINMKDFFMFVIGDSMMDLDAAPYGGSRYPVEARMDGRIFAKFHLDLAIGDVIIEPLETIKSRDWLKFAGIPPASFPIISQEQHFAEKVHAYTVQRERPNSRVRDLVDMVLLIQSDKMNKAKVKQALTATFNRRKTHALPKELKPPFEAWTEPFSTLAEECGLDTNMSTAFELLDLYYSSLK